MKLTDSIAAGKIVSLMGNEVEVWPNWCAGHTCVQCHLEGKIRCAPRFRSGTVVTTPKRILVVRREYVPPGNFSVAQTAEHPPRAKPRKHSSASPNRASLAQRARRERERAEQREQKPLGYTAK